MKAVKDLYDHTVSHSGLSLLLDGPAAYKRYIEKPENADTSYFRKGGMVDCFLTEPTKFEERYAVMHGSIPSGMMGDLIRVYKQLLDVPGDDEPEELFKAAYQVSGYKLTLSAVEKKFNNPENQAYFKFLQDSEGMVVVSKDEADQAAGVAFLLKTDVHTAKYLESKHHDNPLIEVHDQLNLQWEGYGGMTYRGIMDRVIIDHGNKKVIPIDIKTTGFNVLEFKKSYLKYGYYRQGAIYTDGLLALGLIPEGYELENFRFIVADMLSRLPPCVFQMSDADLDAGRNGANWIGSERSVKGYRNLVEDLKHYQQKRSWTHPSEFTETGIVLNNFEQ